MTQPTQFPALTGDPVFFRTYSRFDRVRESWNDVVKRTIDGLLKLGNLDSKQEALLRKYATELKAMPSGRCLWVGGTKWLEQPENFSGAYNCANFSIVSFDRMAFMMSLSMMGVGTGTRLEREFISQLPKISTKLNLTVTGKPGTLAAGDETLVNTSVDGRIVIVVGDSRAGWCRAYELLLNMSVRPGVKRLNITIDLGRIRAAGAKIEGFGGVTNPIGLERMFVSIAKILNGALNRQLTSVEVCLILDEVALAVVAGNVRRCIAGGERVSTENGLREIQDIIVGMKVLASDGQYHLVTDKFDQGIQATLKVKTQDFELSVTSNHRLAVIEGNGYKWVEAGDLQIGDSLVSTLQYFCRDGVELNLGRSIPNELAQTNLVPCRIVSIEPGETTQTYDIEVADVHEFIVNGLLSHNSANMRQFSSNDTAAASAKDNMYRKDENGVFSIDPAKDALRMGNHTLVFHEKPDLARCVEAVTKQYWSGEGAIMWAGESVARANVDILNTPEAKARFLKLYDTHRQFAREFLSGMPMEMESEAEKKEYDHRMDRCGINPCLVAGTMVLTSEGHFPIEKLVGKTVEVWDGTCWRIVDNFRATGQDREVYKVTLIGGDSIVATTNHSFILEDYTRKELRDLRIGDSLFKAFAPTTSFGSTTPQAKTPIWNQIASIEFSHIADLVYCCTIPGSHAFTLSCGVLIGQCGEILGTNFMCVAGDTTIVTKDGMHEIQSLEGREVEVWNGERWSKVVPIKTGSNRKLLRVSFNDGSHLDTTENHRFLVANRFQKQYQTVEAKDLNTHDAKYSIHTPALKILHQEGAEMDLQEAYTLGVITGDGSVDKNEKLQLVLFGEKQKLSIKGKKSVEKQRDGYAATCVEVSDLAWVDKSLIYALKHTHVGFETIATWSRASILAYIAGLADTDGANTGSGGIRIYISRYKRASHIQLLLTKCGIKSSILSIHPKGQVTNFGTRTEDLYAISIVDSADIPCQRLNTSNSHTATCKGKHQVLTDVVELEGVHDTYCFNEPEFHNAVFGNSLTKNCNLSEVHLNQLDPHNLVEQLEAFEAGGLEVAIFLHHEFTDSQQRYSRELDPIVGTSFTGLFDFFVQAFGIGWLRWWQAGRPNKFNMSVASYEKCDRVAELLGVKIKDPFVVMTLEGNIYRTLEAAYLSEWRGQVEKTVGEYCTQNGLKTPNRTTTCQPAGCLDRTAIRIFDQGLLYADEVVEAGSGETTGIELSVRGGTSVSSAIANQPLNLVKVTLKNGRSLRMTQNHRMSIECQWVEAVDLKPGMVIDYQIGGYQNSQEHTLIGINHDLYTRESRSIESGSGRGVLTKTISTPVLMSPDLGYFIGALFGNGCLSEHKYRVRFSHGNLDILNRLATIGKSLFGLDGNITADNRGGRSELTFASKQLFDWIHQNNLAKTSKSKDLNRIPEPIRRSSLDSLLSFFCGLTDTDGCIRKEGKLSIESASEDFIRNLQQIGESIGLSFGVSHNTKGNSHQGIKSMWSLVLSRTKSTVYAIDYLNTHSTKAQSRPIVFSTKTNGGELYTIVSVVHETIPDYSFDFAVDGVDDDDSWYWQGALKSHNTKSLLTGASPGWHPPKAAMFLRRMTFRRNDPVALACIELGYSVIPSQTDKDEHNQLLNDPFDPRCTEWLIEMPIATSWAHLDGVEEIDISKFSAISQFDFYMQVQKYYTTHNTSATIELREEEILPLATKIYESIQNDDGYISAALLQRFDTDFKSYPRLPFEPISKETYDRLVADVATRSSGKTFAEALAKYDLGDLSAEVGPAGCDGDKCLMPEFKPS
jgi:intein/homing endonuclease